MKDKELNFEKALADLEKLVEKLEQSGLGLNESLGLFEKGVHLAKYLRAELEKAEKKVEILLKDDKGGIRREPFSLEDADAGEAAEEDGKDEEGDGAPEKKAARGTKKKTADDGGDKLPF
ncbi:MAG: exodeoxyribonuclease VII small subunit [Candidatus Aminicenantes bacterium]|nr:exodeoxyribonuclease VII small subunit [Candidatus Aminicenantes bacterium]